MKSTIFVLFFLFFASLSSWAEDSLVQVPSKSPENAVHEFLSDYDSWKQSSNQTAESLPLSDSVLRHFSHKKAPTDQFWSYLSGQPHSATLETFTSPPSTSSSGNTSILSTLYASPGALGVTAWAYYYHLVSVPGGWLIDVIERVNWNIDSTQFTQTVKIEEKANDYHNGLLTKLNADRTDFIFKDGGSISFPSGKILLSAGFYDYGLNFPFQLMVPTNKAHVEYEIGSHSAIRITFANPSDVIRYVPTYFLNGQIGMVHFGSALGIVDAKDILQTLPRERQNNQDRLFESRRESLSLDLNTNHQHDGIIFNIDMDVPTAYSFWGVDKSGKPVYLLILCEGTERTGG